MGWWTEGDGEERCAREEVGERRERDSGGRLWNVGGRKTVEGVGGREKRVEGQKEIKRRRRKEGEMEKIQEIK